MKRVTVVNVVRLVGCVLAVVLFYLTLTQNDVVDAILGAILAILCSLDVIQSQKEDRSVLNVPRVEHDPDAERLIDATKDITNALWLSVFHQGSRPLHAYFVGIPGNGPHFIGFAHGDNTHLKQIADGYGVMLIAARVDEEDTAFESGILN